MAKKVIGRPFVKGQPGGPGRPKGLPKERDYLEAFRKRVSMEEWTECVGKQLEKALGGDSKAFEILAKYCLPEPKQIHEWGKDTRDAFRRAGMNDEEYRDMIAQQVVDTFRARREAVSVN